MHSPGGEHPALQRLAGERQRGTRQPGDEQQVVQQEARCAGSSAHAERFLDFVERDRADGHQQRQVDHGRPEGERPSAPAPPIPTAAAGHQPISAPNASAVSSVSPCGPTGARRRPSGPKPKGGAKYADASTYGCMACDGGCEPLVGVCPAPREAARRIIGRSRNRPGTAAVASKQCRRPPGSLPAYAVVSPVRDEAELYARTAASMVAQTVRPVQWVVVDDGSRDGTPAIAESFVSEHEWITVVAAPGVHERARGAPIARAFQHGCAQLHVPVEVVVKMDTDLSPRPTTSSG